MKAEQITLILPGKTCHVMDAYDEEEEMILDLPYIYPSAFDDDYIENKIHRLLEIKGVRIVRNAQLMQIMEDEEN